MNEFCRYELRTTDADAARDFYTKVLGHDRAVIWPLHEQARARGATPHWLGHVAVADVEATTAAFVARGATSYGPVRPTSYGGQAAVLRDPGGALLAIATPPATGTPETVAVSWHVLTTNDAARAITNYRELLGWEVSAQIDHIADREFRRFACRPGGVSAGAIGDVATMRGVHPQWLYFFAVAALEPAIAAVRAGGGLALDPVVTPSGERVCVCDDPQGAAFAIWEPRASA